MKVEIFSYLKIVLKLESEEMSFIFLLGFTGVMAGTLWTAMQRVKISVAHW